MKSLITSSLFFFAILMSSLTGFSQESTFEFGVEGGPNALFLRGDFPAEISEPLMGANLGLAFQYNFSNRTSIRTGLMLHRKKTEWDTDVVDNTGRPQDIDISQNFDYLTIPVLLRVYFGENRNFYLNAGPYAGILLNDNYEVSGSDSEDYENVALFNGGFVDTYDYGITAGFGLNILTVGPLKIAGEVRNDFGIADISSDANSTIGEIKTNTPSLLLSVMFGL